MTQSETTLPQQPKRASLLQIVKAVAWSLLGVRKQKSYENDVSSITPGQTVFALLFGLAVFITTIVTLVILATNNLR